MPILPTFRKIARSLLTAPVRKKRPGVRVERLEDRLNPAPAAAVTGLPADTQPLLGDPVSYNLTFANAAPVGVGNTGFAPFIELAVDTSGADGTTFGGTNDGIGIPAVTAAGLTLTPRGSVTVSGANYTNPITGESRTLASVYGSRFNAGDMIYFYALPFGSFTPAQTTAVTVALPTSNRADVNTPMPVSVVGGFRDDDPSLAGPAFYAPRADGTITPQLYRLNKIYQGPESETATGPNYVRRYRLEVDIATGQTVSDLRITDTLANTMQLVARDATVIAGAPNVAAFLGGTNVTNLTRLSATGGAATGATVPTTPGGSLTYNFLPTGTYTAAAGVDAALEFNFYVPRDADTAGGAVAPDPANPTVPQGTDSTTAVNAASSTLDWTPLDLPARDPAQNDIGPAATGSTLTHTLEQQSVAIQKTAAVVDRATGLPVAAGAPIRPGQALVRYTLDFQVSDYFALNDVFVRDALGDGQRLYLGPIAGNPTTAFPTLAVNNAFLTGAPGTRQTTTGAFAGAQAVEYQRRYSSGNADSDPTSFADPDGPAAVSPVFRNLAASVQPDGPGSDAGQTYLQFNVSQELQARLGATAGRLVGAEILNDGTGPQNDNHPQTNPPPGAVTGTIVFYAEVTEEFSDLFRVANGGSGDPTVDQGDVLGNTVNDPRTPLRDGVFGDQLAAATVNSPTPTVIGRGSDDSGSALSIPYGLQSKQLVAINGQGVPAQTFANPPFAVQPGDEVTYLLTYTLPISRFEQLRLVDFPPLPVMNLGAAPNNAPTFTRNPAAYGFNPGEVGVFVNGVTPGGLTAPAFVSDTYFNTFAPGNGAGRNPALSIDAPNNGLTLNFGTQDDIQDRSTTISVLVTFTVGNDPFSADLFLTNQLRVLEGSTNAGTTTVEDLRRFELVRPTLALYKGIVGTLASGGAPAGTTFGDVVFTGPGTAFGFSNQLNTVAEATDLGNANTATRDAGDQVRFALVAQNIGKGDAFDTRIRDVLPTGYAIPAAFPGRVFRGASGAAADELVAGTDYTVVSYNAATGDFVIELTDNYTAGNVGGAAEDARGGALSRGTRVDQTTGNRPITNGSNAVVVLFDLTLVETVAPGQTLTNTATIPVYSNSDNGPNYTDPAVVPGATVPSDTATVTVPVPLTKTIVSTSEAFTPETGTGAFNSPRLVAIGETVRYRLAVQLAEGVATNFQVDDNLPSGLTFLNDGTARVVFVSNGGGITSTTLAGAGLAVTGSAAVAPTFAIPGGAITPAAFATGTDPIFSLGTLTNADRDADAEFVVIEFNTLTDNSVAGSNDAGDTRDNTFTARVSGADVTTSTTETRVRVVEPSITNVLKASTPTSGDAGDTITFTVTFSNANGASNTTAFDVVLTDAVPAVGYDSVTFLPASLTTTGATNAAVSVVGNTVTFTADSLAAGGTVSFQYTARLVASVGPGTYTNTANLTYTSLPGANGAAAPGAPGTDTGERTGSGVGPNDYLDSDSEDVLVNAPVAKTIVGTNQAFTTGNTVAVGEQVQYQVVVTIPEGTSPAAALRDALPAGMAVVSLDSLTVSADVGLTTDVAGGYAQVLADARAALASPGQAFGFSLGNLTNADRDPGAETLTFTYTVVVLNTLGNQRGTTLTNSATYRSGGVDRTTASAPPVTVAEPTLRVTKTAGPTTGDASLNDADAVTFTLTVDHAPGSNADAFDVALSDAIPAGFTYVAGSLGYFSGVVPAAFGVTGTTITASYTGLTTAQSSTLTFRARLNATTAPGQVVTNTASITYTSLPGDVTTPQSAFNASSVERTGADGDNAAVLNNYATSGAAAVTVNSNQIGGNIYRDFNNNGVLDGGETLISGPTRVQLTGTDNLGNTITPVTLTATTGTYNFTGLRPGTYTVTELDQPAGLLDGRDTPGTSSPGTAFGGTGTGATAARAPRDADAVTAIVIGLGASKTGINYNFGELPTASLGDFVWHDRNGDGVQSAGEPGLNGVAVTLTGTDDSGQPVNLPTTTANNPSGGAPGYYQFAGLRPSGGTGYTVTFGTLPGFARTARDATTAPGYTDALDSDGDPTTGATAPVALGVGASIQTIDQGLYQPVSLGNRVYFDLNGDGIQQAGEPGIPGTAIQVVWLGPDGAVGGGDDRAFSTTTGVDGIWTVPDLPPGSYTVTATPPAGPGWLLTDSLDLGGPPSPVNPVGVSTPSGMNRTDVDFGFRGTAALGNRVYVDADGDGVQDANGLEPGLPGVVVTLRFDANGNGLFTDPDDGLFTTTTDGAGLYAFRFLPAGAYQVSVSAAGGAGGVPLSMALTDSLDNGGAASPVAAVTKTLALGETDNGYDFGYRGNASLGDYAYYDANGDGVQTANEPPLAGVAVTAVWYGPNSALGGGDDVTFTTTTDAAGLYTFPGLPANALVGGTPNYRVTVVAPAALPTLTDSLDNGGAASPVNPVDVQVSPVDGAPLNDRTDVDFGFRGAASLGDFVWLDSNGNGRQDGGTEVGVVGVTVQLFFDRNGDTDFADPGENVALLTTTTVAAGAYTFTGLAAGNYQVAFGSTAAGVTYARTVADVAAATDALDSDADPTTGRTGTYMLANGGSNPTVDAGLYVPISLGDRVYFDADADGVQDTGEPGIPGAAIQVVWFGPDGVFGGTDDRTFNTTTGVNGIWAVPNLPPGNFRVTATPPAGAGWTLTDSLDLGGPPSPVNPVGVSTTSGASRTDVDFGFRSTGALGNRVYVDADGDGMQDANGLEPGLPGVTVTLRYDANSDGDFADPDDGLFTTTTDGAGLYSFTALPPGAYQVSVSAAGGAGGVPLSMALTDSLDNGGAASPVAAVTKTLTLGETDNAYDFGYRGNASLGDYAYYDANGDGVQTANEPPLAGVAVTAVWYGPNGILGGGDDVTFTTTTDAAGFYTFPGLPANALVGGTPNYRVTVTPPAAFPTLTDSLDNGGAASPVSPVDVQVSPVDGAPLNDRTDVDFGFRGTASLGDFVWLDANGNGTQDGGEVGVVGVAVQLFFDRNGDTDFADPGENVALATTTTVAAGAYSFTGLAAGNYQVAFGSTAAGVTYARTVADSAVATDLTDSDADPATGRTGTYMLANGANIPTVDAGLYVPVSLGDRVYYDRNGDGVQQVGELGIPGVGVTVVWHGPDGAFGGTDDRTFNTTTVANGIWTVPNLPPGTYTVTAAPPAGAGFDTFTDSLDNGGAASPVNPVVVSTTSGASRTDIDFGYRGVGGVGDRVFLDVNANGQYDAGEGLDGVTVTLTGDLNGDGTPDTLTATTAADGFYQFTNLRVTVGGVPYTVTVDPATLPQAGGGRLTNTVDPDTANPGDNTAVVTLTAAAPNNQAQDFGYRTPGRIGDTVFLDANGNGAPDAGEGISGVLVRLRGDVDGDGTPEEFFRTTTAAGVYDFPNLPVFTPAGAAIAYTVTVDPNGTTLPAGVTNTTDPDGGNDGVSALTLDPLNPVNLAQDFGYRGPGSIGDTVFLDVNANGAFDAGEGLAVITVSLTADLNGDGVAETLTAATDADGFYQFTGLPVFQNDGTTAVPYVVTVVAATLPAGLTNTVDPDTASPGNGTSALTLSTAAPSNPVQDFGYRGAGRLGDRVWIDANGDGVQGPVALEPGLPGVGLTITWSGADDTFGTADDVTSATTTDAAGGYTFTGLPLDSGRFRVAVTPATLPTSAVPTFDLDGTATPNDAGGAAAITLTTAAPARTDVDFGYAGTASLGDRVYLDLNGDGVQQATENGVPGATVQLTWGGPDGDLATTADNVVFTATTAADGTYLFPGLLVNGASDDYRVQVTALPITGLVLTDSLDDGALSAANPVTLAVDATGANQNRRDADFGYAGLGSLAGTVYRDDDNSGRQGAGEPGLAGVVLTLTGVDAFGNPVLDPLTGLPYTTTTDVNGAYQFAALVPGTYQITETQPVLYADGTDVAGTLAGTAGNDVISGIVVGANQAGTGYDFGEIPAFVRGTVFRDDNRDGAPQPGEPGIPNVRVELRDPADNRLIDFTTTDANGNYAFERLPAGTYRVVEVQPAGYADSPVGPATVRDVTVPTIGLTDQNFGEILGSLSGRVYLDADNSGTRDAGEPGIAIISITLTGTDLNGTPVSVTVTTDGQGRYTFPNLLPADAAGYAVTEGASPPFIDRASNPGTGFATPGTNPTPNTFTGLNLTPAQDGVDYDFGETRPPVSFIAGSVFRDDSRDGARQPGEPGVGGVTVQLFDSLGRLVDTRTTDANGDYRFPALIPGITYTVVETQPVVYADGPVGPATRIVVPNLPDTGSAGNDFPEVLGSLNGTVYFDRDLDGARTAGEPGIGGVTLTLTGTDLTGAAVTRTATTAADGSYRFDFLPAGTYAVTETQPTAYFDGRETIGTAGGTLTPPDSITAITLGAGVTATTYDFGEVGVPVSGTVFYDRNRDGTAQPGDAGIGGVRVELRNPDGSLVAFTTTDANGNYLFPLVPPGAYTLVEVQPPGYGDPAGGPFAPNARPITVVGTPVTGQNFGDTLGTLAGTVYLDPDASNSLTAGDTGLGGVAVRLDGAGPDGTFGTADDVTGFRTTATVADGTYVFTDLPAGVYRVVEPTQPPFADAAETAGSAGGDTATNDQITNVPVAAGTDLTGYNFGERDPAAAGPALVSGTVYLDTNGNGRQDAGEPGLAGVTVTLTGPAATLTATTDATGNYAFTNLPPGFDYVVTETQPAAYGTGPEVPGNVIAVPFLRPTGSTGNNFGETPATIAGTVYFDADAGGALDAADVRLPGVTVTLLDGAGNPVAAAATDAAGNYAFTNLPAGAYRVMETQPAAYNQGTNTPGAGAVVNGTDRLDVILPAGGASPGNNFGELGAPIRGRVYLDGNRNGTRDPEDTAGLGGVTITLLDGSGNPVRTTTTGPDGTYSFDNLPAGDYTLVQTQPATAATTSANVLPVVLTPAGVINQDFGETFGTLAGTVYADTNANGARDPGEAPLGGVTVTLTGTDANGAAVTRTTTTGPDGAYRFTDLPAGTYQVTETQPPAFDDGADTVGTAGGVLAAPDTIRDIPLAAGANPTGYDFAEVTSSLSGFVYADFDMNGARTTTGPRAETGAYVPGTNTPGGIGGIVITLTGFDRDGRPVTRTATTAADGSYVFTGLGAGTYTLAEAQPPFPTTMLNGFYDGAETAGSVGGTVVAPGPDFAADPNKNRIVAVSLPTGASGVNYNFGELPPADPFGFVYVDANRNGVRDPGEAGIAGSSVSLSGTAFAGTPFARPLTAADVPGGLTRLTDAAGRYEFAPIPPGLYTLTQDRQPAGFADGRESDGDPNGPAATVGNEVISNIALAPFPIRGPFNFGEIALPAPPGVLPPIDFFPVVPADVSKRMFLTTTPDEPVPPGAATAPNFAGFNPGVRPTAMAAVAEGPGGSGLVRVFDFAGGNERFRFRPFGDFAGGARVATADVTGDGIPDIIAVPGVGGGPVVKVFDGSTGAEVRSVMAFEPEFRGGLRVAAADLNGDFVADLIVTPDAGGGPIVRAFDGRTGAVIANFFALDPTFRGGLRVATGDVNRDGTSDLVVTAGEGGGPRVAVYDGRTLTGADPARLAGDFFGFAPELRSGFWVTAADVDGDGFADLVMGAGAGGGPRVAVYSGRVFAAGGGNQEIASFFAGEPTDRGGARVLAADLDGDGRAEVLTGSGAGAWPLAYVYDPLTGVRRDTFYATAAAFRGGIEVG